MEAGAKILDMQLNLLKVALLIYANCAKGRLLSLDACHSPRWQSAHVCFRGRCVRKPFVLSCVGMSVATLDSCALARKAGNLMLKEALTDAMQRLAVRLALVS